MKLKYITCSDPHEHVSFDDMKHLASLSPKVEFGIQAHMGPMSENQPRNEWFTDALTRNKSEKNPVKFALHVNYEWCVDMCNNIMPDTISKWLNEKHYLTGNQLINRVQLNIGDGMWMHQLSPQKTAAFIHSHPTYEFIFPYNDITSVFIADLHRLNIPFSLLYDSSYGIGKLPDTWNAPVYNNHPQGYAGGLSPDNVKENIDKISKILPQNYKTWVDAEGQLMRPKTRYFDIAKAEKYILQASR